MPDWIDEDLRRFIGPGNMKFFDIIHLNTSFLHKPVVSWERNSHSHEAKRTVVNLAVTNDAAQRGVKLCADFKDSVRKEDSLQTVLQTVENERAKQPNIQNMNQQPTSWFLAID